MAFADRKRKKKRVCENVLGKCFLKMRWLVPTILGQFLHCGEACFSRMRENVFVKMCLRMHTILDQFLEKRIFHKCVYKIRFVFRAMLDESASVVVC